MRNMVWVAAVVLSAAVTLTQAPATVGQTPAAAPTAPAWSPSRDIGVFVFGRNGQTADQQLKDESECYGAARQQSGIDPKAPPLPRRLRNRRLPSRRPPPKMRTTCKEAGLPVPRAGPPVERQLARSQGMPAREPVPALWRGQCAVAHSSAKRTPQIKSKQPPK